jgi:hypothetical protein
LKNNTNTNIIKLLKEDYKMKNKTIKKLTKGIVAIALTIATVVGAGVIGAQEYNAYTTGSNSCGTYV